MVDLNNDEFKNDIKISSLTNTNSRLRKIYSMARIGKYLRQVNHFVPIINRINEFHQNHGRH